MAALKKGQPGKKGCYMSCARRARTRHITLFSAEGFTGVIGWHQVSMPGIQYNYASAPILTWVAGFFSVGQGLAPIAKVARL